MSTITIWELKHKYRNKYVYCFKCNFRTGEKYGNDKYKQNVGWNTSQKDKLRDYDIDRRTILKFIFGNLVCGDVNWI
jgi:hypothetical protein